MATDGKGIWWWNESTEEWFPEQEPGGDLINSEGTSLETWLIDEQVTTPPPPDQAIVIHRLCDLTVVICQQVLQGCLLRRLAFVLPSWKNTE